MTAAAPTVRCRVCNADVPADAPRCPKCSAALGEQPPCPHCRATAGTSPDRELRFRCDVCGGPRVPRGKEFVASGREIGSLKVAEAARRARAAYRAGAVFFGLATPFVSAVLMLLALMFGVGLGWALGAVFTIVPLGLAFVFTLLKARAKSHEIAPALDTAWVSVAGDVARAHGSIPTPAELAKHLGIDDGQAEELAALLDVSNLDALPPPLRIEDVAGSGSPAASATTTAPGDAAALERAAEEEAAAAEGHAATVATPKRTS